MLALRGGGDWLDRTLRIPRRPPGLAPPPDEVPAPQIIGRPSEVEPLLERAGQRAAEVERQAAQTSRASLPSSWQKQKHRRALSDCCRSSGGGGGGGREEACWQHWAREHWRRREPWVQRRRLSCGGSRRCHRGHGVGHRGRAQCGGAHVGCHHRRRHGQRRLATLSRHRRADTERDAGVGRRGTTSSRKSSGGANSPRSSGSIPRSPRASPRSSPSNKSERAL